MTTTVDLDSMHGHYEVVWSPDEDCFWVSLWWKPDDDSPHFRNAISAHAWAKKRGGHTAHRT